MTEIKTKHLMRLSKMDIATTDLIRMPKGKESFAKALAMAVYNQKDCRSFADWLEKTREATKDFMELSIEQMQELQNKSWKFNQWR